LGRHSKGKGDPPSIRLLPQLCISCVIGRTVQVIDWFTNNATGERRGPDGKPYRPAPGFVSEPIIPGVYPANHPARFPPPNFKTNAK